MPPDIIHVNTLRIGHIISSDKRRIPHDILQLFFRYDLIPVDSQRISFCDVHIGFQREEILVEAVDDALRFFEHLGFRDPERGLRDRHGEVIDLDAVKLLDRDLNRVQFFIAKSHLSVESFLEDLILESAKAEIGFGQEITGACCRIQAYDGRELMLEGIELVPLRFRLPDLSRRNL